MTEELMTPRALKARLPLSKSAASFIASSRKTAVDIVTRKDDRLLCVIGPCSVHEVGGALNYARELKRLSEQVSEHLFIVMRLFGEKPRTHHGWKGLLYDPALDGSCDVAGGVRIVRELLLEIANLGVPVATECLEPLSALFTDDLITWGFVGARTSASPPNRHLASLLPFPFGFKNSVEGNLEPAINGVLTASVPHTFLYANEEGEIAVRESRGNPHCHIVLRGSSTSSNYSREHVQDALIRLHEAGAPKRILIDCAHGNCQKRPERQIVACMSVLDQIEEGNSSIFGFMLESYLNAGSQPLMEDPSSLISGISITDPCLSWDQTERLILTACERASLMTGIRS